LTGSAPRTGRLQCLLVVIVGLSTCSQAAPPRVLVVYATRHNHTASLGASIAEGAESVGGLVRIRCIRGLDARYPDCDNPVNFTTDVLEWADALVIGSPTHYANPAASVLAWVESEWVHSWSDERMQAKIGGVFTTAGAIAQGMEHALSSLTHVLESFRIRVVTPDPTSSGYASSFGAIAITGTPPFNATVSGIHSDFVPPARAFGAKIARTVDRF